VNALTRWNARVLLVDGAMASRAVFPTNGSSLIYTNQYTQSDFSYINYNPGDVPSTMVAANAECMIDFSYGSQTLQVAYITNATRTIKFTDFVGDGFGGEAGTRNGSGGIQWIPDIQTYRIYNTAEGMAQPGQFYWDKTANIVYYFPLPGKSPNSSTIIVPTTDRIFFYSGYGNIHPGGSGASPFTLSNLTLQVNAVNVEPEGNFGYLWDHESLFAIETQAGGTGLSFLNCTMGSCGGNAIGADFGFVSNVNILNCTISNCGGYGVAMRMAGPVVVSNNYIHDCGLISGSSGKFESDASFMAGFGA
jgi:parallel beta-helix repeat protein